MTFLVGFSIGFIWANLGQSAAVAFVRKEGRVEALCLFVTITFLMVWWLTTV